MRRASELFLHRVREQTLPNFVEELILFGSEVYGKPTIFSDIDIAVVCSAPPTIEERCSLDETLDSCDPPFAYQLVYVNRNAPTNPYDVRNDIFKKGVTICVR